MIRDHETAATVKITGKSGRVMIASAIFERDPQRFTWNRMVLLGDKNQMQQAMRIQSDGPITWEKYSRSDWAPAVDGDRTHHTRGAGSFRRTGLAHGLSIADDSIQKIAEIELYDCIETIQGKDLTTLSCEFWFLQRPVGWWAHSRRIPLRDQNTTKSDWRRIPKSSLRFRLLKTGYQRWDQRTSHEREIVDIPGIELSSTTPNHEPAAFFVEAERIWFLMRILMTFRFRQYIAPLYEARSQPGQSVRTWRPIELKPIVKTPAATSSPFHGSLERFLAKGIASLSYSKAPPDLMHAATFGYAGSFSAGSLETGLTNCVEALERLLTAFEHNAGLDREIMSRKDWRKVASALKAAISNLVSDKSLEDRLKRTLTTPVTLSLQERLERMVDCYRANWSDTNLAILAGLPKLVKARNDIVHGRLVSDPTMTYIETLRAHALFETLFMQFIDCHDFDTASEAISQLWFHETYNMA